MKERKRTLSLLFLFAPEQPRRVQTRAPRGSPREMCIRDSLMLGIFANETATIKRIFSAHGITKAGFVAELKKVKTGPVTSDNPCLLYTSLRATPW